MTHDQSTHDRMQDIADRPDISSLASTVLSVLGDKADDGYRVTRPSVVAKLRDACLLTAGYDVDLVLDMLADNRVQTDQVIDLYIPEVARVLGTMWMDDDISFAWVTIATARLQGLLNLLATPWQAQGTTGDGDNPIAILMILPTRDAHTLGVHVAVAQLRRLGASVRVIFDIDGDGIADIVAEEPYDLIMFSCAATRALSTIHAMVARARFLNPDMPPFAVGGLVLELADRIKERTGVDLVTSDVRVAFKLCDRKRVKTKAVAP